MQLWKSAGGYDYYFVYNNENIYNPDRGHEYYIVKVKQGTNQIAKVYKAKHKEAYQYEEDVTIWIDWGSSVTFTSGDGSYYIRTYFERHYTLYYTNFAGTTGTFIYNCYTTNYRRTYYDEDGEYDKTEYQETGEYGGYYSLWAPQSGNRNSYGYYGVSEYAVGLEWIAYDGNSYKYLRVTDNTSGYGTTRMAIYNGLCGMYWEIDVDNRFDDDMDGEVTVYAILQDGDDMTTTTIEVEDDEGNVTETYQAFVFGDDDTYREIMTYDVYYYDFTYGGVTKTYEIDLKVIHRCVRSDGGRMDVPHLHRRFHPPRARRFHPRTLEGLPGRSGVPPATQPVGWKERHGVHAQRRFARLCIQRAYGHVRVRRIVHQQHQRCHAAQCRDRDGRYLP